MSSFKDFILITEAYNVSYFHGTSIRLLPKILQQGLKADASVRNRGLDTPEHERPFVFLTPDKELAARYAVGLRQKEMPAVLELNLSMPKRIKKVEYDPLDRPEVIWDYDGYESPGGDDVDSLERDIETVYKKFVAGYRDISISNVFDLQNGLGVLQGFDVYRFVLELIKKNIGETEYRFKQAQIKATLHQQIPPNSKYDFIEISPSGTIRISNKYYQSHNQYRYPQSISPAAIKSVWVRESDFPNMEGLREKIAMQYLPDEGRDRYEKVENYLNKIHYDLEGWVEDEDVDEIENWIIENDDDDNISKISSMLINIVSMLDSGDKEEAIEQASLISNEALGILHRLDPQYYESMSGAKETWIKVDAKKILGSI